MIYLWNFDRNEIKSHLIKKSVSAAVLIHKFFQIWLIRNIATTALFDNIIKIWLDCKHYGSAIKTLVKATSFLHGSQGYQLRERCLHLHQRDERPLGPQESRTRPLGSIGWHRNVARHPKLGVGGGRWLGPLWGPRQSPVARCQTAFSRLVHSQSRNAS